ncbi:uncharacterized protein LOC119106477 isoform X2 [Pollicipes pollicipes]|uniref:uncharacterized protein LOC119106477 isoform X2 n=1 Tax=Pollicipes pollicipes TaxID=41117 RepID=UPI0018857E2E|nr:uncharacterized protein LOC119106477 isoform X2 [Pollicipes pollicipes]
MAGGWLLVIVVVAACAPARAAIACQGFRKNFCNIGCGFQTVQEMCCRCHGECCPPPADHAIAAKLSLAPGPPTYDGSCTDNTGASRPAGSHWYDNNDHPCRKFTCARGVVVTLFDHRDRCRTDSPHCPYTWPAGKCCRVYHCPTTTPPPPTPPVVGRPCYDELNQLHGDGEEWTSPGQPCVQYRCENGLVVTSAVGCPLLPPGCVAGAVPPGECCPSVSCTPPSTGCTYGGNTYTTGQHFPDDPLHPCQQKVCDHGLVVSLGAPQHCAEPACANPIWPVGDCCRSCPPGSGTSNLDKLKNAVQQLAQHLGLGQAQLDQLEGSLHQLVNSLGGLIQGTGGTTIESLLKNIIYLLNILGVPSPGHASGDLNVLLHQLQYQLVALVDQLGSSLTADQITNAKIKISELIEWLRSYDSSNPTASAGTLLADLTALFTGLLPEAGSGTSNLDKLKNAVQQLAQHLGLGQPQLDQLEGSLHQLVNSLGGLIQGTGGTTIESLLKNIIYLLNILGVPSPGHASGDLNVLLHQLQYQLVALVDQLGSSLTADQITNAKIKISELIEWLRSYDSSNPTASAGTLLADLTALFTGLLPEAGSGTSNLDKLKNAVQQLAQHLGLGQPQLDQLEGSLHQLVNSLGGLIQGTGGTTIESLLKNIIYLLNILGVPSPGHASGDLNVLLHQLQYQLVALVDQLGSSLTADQITNAKIKISEFIEWLRSYDSSNPTASAGTLLADLAALFTGLLPEAGSGTSNLDKLKNAVQQLAQHLGLGQPQLDQLEGSLHQLVNSLGGLIQGTGGTTIESLLKNIIYLLNILGVPSPGHASGDLNVLLHQLQYQLVALVDQLGSSLTADQITNAKIKISEFIEWLRSYDSNNPTASAGTLLADLAALFTGLLPEAGSGTSNLDKLKNAVQQLAQHLGLGQPQLDQLEGSLHQLVNSLGGLIQGTGGTTIESLLKNIIYLLNILGVPSPGNPGGGLHALVNQLQYQLAALLDQLGPSLTDDQINNAKIDIREFIEWLRSYDGNNPSTSAGILLADLTTLFSGILPEPGCTDAAGTVHQLNTVYVDDPSSPQYCYLCANSTAGVGPLLVLDITKNCGAPPPGCTSRAVPNNCCPAVDCSPGEAACRDPNGALHQHGSTFVDDPIRPCITYRCNDGVIEVIDKITCMDVPEGCTSWLMNGRCCPKSDCPAEDCVYKGRERDHGTSWPQNPARPCVILTCLNGDVSSQDLTSLCPPPPQPHCVKRHVAYQCCPAYDCVTVNCTYNNVVYTEGQTWPDDPVYPCKRFKCTRSGTEKVEDQTPHCRSQPHPRCQGHRKPQQCCKHWDCPQCTQDGTTHPEGDVWWDNPARRCVKYTCRHGIVLQLDNLLPCQEVPDGCRPNFKGTECCHFKYTCPFCMFDPLGNLIQKVGTSLG